MVSQRNQPFHPIRPQTIFNNVQEHFEDLRHVKQGRTCVSSLDAIYRVSELRKWILNRINHSIPLGPTRCLRVFRSILKTFGTSNEEELVLPSTMHYIGVPKLRTWFRNKINRSTALDPKRYLQCLGAFRRPSARQTRKYLFFEP